MILPEDTCTCQEIHSLAAEIYLLAKNIKSAKELCILESIMLKLTAISYKCVSKIATERELLDKVHSCVSMVFIRKSSIQQNAVSCQLHKEFAEYFANVSPAKESVVSFYNRLILPMIDAEPLDIFGLKFSSSTIQEHLIDKYFLHQNFEIMGLIILNFNLNKLETDFCNVIINHSNSWKPNYNQIKSLIEFIRSNNPKEDKLNLGKNRLVKIFLNDIDVQGGK
ncbi:unnamed protein product [Allacma fusca]|uniref:Uncharacterized protein n=1 Tax=Allacma fusca TaxID=39272 RepID=A0A8J2LJF4_9HEXA|nr:unnamed protein product [Allacma fusca]